MALEGRNTKNPEKLCSVFWMDRELLGQNQVEIHSKLDDYGLNGLYRLDTSDGCSIKLEVLCPKDLVKKTLKIFQEIEEKFSVEPPEPPAWASALGFEKENSENLRNNKNNLNNSVNYMLACFAAAWFLRNMEFPASHEGSIILPYSISFTALSIISSRIQDPVIEPELTLMIDPGTEQWKIYGFEDYDLLQKDFLEMIEFLDPEESEVFVFPKEDLAELGCQVIQRLAASSGDSALLIENSGCVGGPDTRLAYGLRHMCDTAGRNFTSRVMLSTLLAELDLENMTPELDRTARITKLFCSRL